MADDLDVSSLYKELSGNIEKVYGQLEKQQVETNKRMAGEEQELKRLSAERQKLIKDVPEPAPLPKLEDLPAPPKEKFSDPSQALGAPLSLFALLGSLMTRAPATAMLNAAAGVMQGFHQGEKDQMDYEMKRFDAAMRQAVAQQNQELAKYSAAMDQKRFKAEVRAANIEAATAEYNDVIAREEFRQRGEQGLAQLLEKRLAAQTTLASSLIHWQMYLKAAQFRATGHVTALQEQKNQEILQAREMLKAIEADPAKKKTLDELLKKFPGGKYPRGNVEVGGMHAADIAILDMYQKAKTPLIGGESQAGGESETTTQAPSVPDPVAGAKAVRPDGTPAPEGAQWQDTKNPLIVKNGVWVSNKVDFSDPETKRSLGGL